MDASNKKIMDELMQKLMIIEITELVNLHRPELIKKVRAKLKDMSTDEVAAVVEGVDGSAPLS